MRKFLDRGAVHLKDACEFTPGCNGRSIMQGYWVHLKFAAKISLMLIRLGLKGLTHALIPSVYGFNLIKELYHIVWVLKDDIPTFPHWDKYDKMLRDMEDFK